ncbi:hypothetical protein MJN51_31750, partial [Salmonella enterica subsp. enterica serovar Kentucky]|nr:hypothetical protein [Salmonella enterica subsp. enterica serovar Kentucky]
AEVYLAMTGGQTSMTFAMEGETQRQQGEATIQRIVRQASRLRMSYLPDNSGVVYADGMSTHGFDKRAAILAKVNGVVLKAKDLQ